MKKEILIASVILTAMFLALVQDISAQTYANCPGMMGGMYGAYGGTGMVFGWVLYLLVIALIIAAIYWLIKSANRRR